MRATRRLTRRRCSRIEANDQLLPLADLDPKDITPSSAYARLLAMVRDYADERGVS